MPRGSQCCLSGHCLGISLRQNQHLYERYSIFKSKSYDLSIVLTSLRAHPDPNPRARRPTRPRRPDRQHQGRRLHQPDHGEPLPAAGRGVPTGRIFGLRSYQRHRPSERRRCVSQGRGADAAVRCASPYFFVTYIILRGGKPGTRGSIIGTDRY